MHRRRFPDCAGIKRNPYEVESGGLGFHWRGRSFGGLELSGMLEGDVAWSALNTAHDVVLEGLGEDGEHPRALASAHVDVQPVAGGWQLRLLTPDGETLRQEVWRTST
ncbi:hypothetical protein GCM10010914_04230 [Deinococcus wulumuqiensis]|uniref:Uncharacterized protein n=1 Tax=Deinococcus wulumuqiensis TaxID=980427 RepID=A0AAV4K0Q8_9DEIO|nr:hypothetical protein GCM10010914_04230 [Deinococcus wulumuqiensis]GGP28647.1 hypothetical protein GCM10008021_02980 [Deinococcus wulumuqiensis]